MLKEEFEKIAGYEVSYDTYKNIIEPMYNAIPENITKYEFVKMFDKKAFALPSANSYLKIVKEEAKHLFEICGKGYDWQSQERMERAAKNYMKRKYGIDWYDDMNAYCSFTKGSEFSNGRGCTFPKELVIGYIKGATITEYERITLNKEDSVY